MLVLTRKINESVVIGDNIVVTVVAIQGNKVRLGINSPRETPVHREEIFDRIHAEPTHRQMAPTADHVR